MAKLYKCPVCGNTGGNLSIEHRKNIPVLQNITLDTELSARNFPTGDLGMQWCAGCSFVWNDAFDPEAINYDANYNNDVSNSKFYLKHLEAMADNVLKAVPANEPVHYVEIGCGNADFMKLVLERSNGRCISATGFDPSFSSDEILPDEIVVHKTMFGHDQLELISPDTNIICSRHTIEHIAEPGSFISALASATSKNSTKLLLETPDADWILHNAAFQDFFYEHCSIYTPRSMRHLLAAHGLLSKITSVYNGQYMWIEASREADQNDDGNSNTRTEYNLALAKGYVEKSIYEFKKWHEFLLARQQVGKIAIWGAASKGVTFNLLFSSQNYFECAIDLNPAKQNRFLPATGLAVVSPKTAMERGVETVIVMNPNYAAEIEKMVEDMGWKPEISVLNDFSG